MRSSEANPVKLVRERLDAEGVAAHLRGLAEHAREIEIRVKGGSARHSDATVDSLDEVGRRLVAGELVAIEIRFFQDDDWWSDTVMAAKSGFRLVRMREGT